MAATGVNLFPGVYRHRRKFVARVPAGRDGQWDYLGLFADPLDANRAVREARRDRGLPEPRYRVTTTA